MDLRLMFRRAVRRLRQVGLWATLSEEIEFRFRGSMADDFDLHYGIETSKPVPLWKLRIDSPNARFGTKYQTMDAQALIDSIGLLHEDPHDFTFVDLGCGKGRALLVAAHLGFKQVIGVEFSNQLAEIAEKHLAVTGVDNAVVVKTDAAAYRFPNSDLIVYLFNPFSHEVMQRAIANLGESISRKIYVIYAVPMCAALLDASGFLTRLGCPQGRSDIQIWRSARSPVQAKSERESAVGDCSLPPTPPGHEGMRNAARVHLLRAASMGVPRSVPRESCGVVSY